MPFSFIAPLILYFTISKNSSIYLGFVEIMTEEGSDWFPEREGQFLPWWSFFAKTFLQV